MDGLNEAHFQWRHKAVTVHRKILHDKAISGGKTWNAFSEEDLIFLAMSMGGEAGEVLNDIKKWMRGDFNMDQLKEKVRKEIADVQILLYLLAETMNLDLDEEAASKMTEVAARWEKP